MEEIHQHHHHHHHHGHKSNDQNQGHSYATSSQGAVNSVIMEYQQQQQQENLSVPIEVLNASTNQTFEGVKTTNSFHSVSSADSTAEMSKYFPDAQTPQLSPFSHQQVVEGQVQSTAASNTAVTTNINTVNAGPYIPVSAPTAVQQLPQAVRVPFMAQQQRPVRPTGRPQPSSGIPSYSSQIDGLSVSQAVVNDVLVDLQSKVINESLQQYQNESSSGAYLEPLPPIYIRAPQPTIILRSDLHRLRAELNSRVRPPVVYRHPAGANQFQQHRFQQNTFQTPQFPAPPQQFIPPEYYGAYQNTPYASSDEYKTTTGDEHTKEHEERLYNQAESPMLNDDNINDNVHNAFDLQGLSTTSFDRHASPYQTSSFLPNLEDQRQGNEATAITSSYNINDQEVGRTDNMFSGSIRPRQEITFDINNCVFRCFEAHRQRVARRRAARQARRAKRHKQSGQQQQQQQQYQQLYHTDPYQNFPTQPTYASIDNIEKTQWKQQPATSAHYSDIIPELTNTSTAVHTSQGSYVPTGSYDYTNVAQTSSLPTDIQQYQSLDAVNIHTSQIPFSSLSTTNIDATVPSDVQSSGADYYQYKAIDTHEPYVHSNVFDYASHQAVPATTDFIQQPPIEQQQQQAQASFDYSSQSPYTSYTSTDATVPSGIQHLTSGYYQQQQQQIPSQFIQNQETYVQPSSTFDYTGGSTHIQLPTYDHQNIEQQSYQYPYNAENIQTEQKQTFDYSNQALNSSDYYQQQPITLPASQTQGAYGQPTGTFEYTRESYQSQEPIYDYQGTDQQSSQYSYNVEDIQQKPQQDSYHYASTVANTHAPSHIDANLTAQSQTFDYSSQGLSSSDYYQQQPVSVPASQVQGTYAQSSGTFDYTAGSTQSQEPIYNYQDAQQIASQYPYNIGNIEQQSFDYTSEATAAYAPPEINIPQTKQNQTFDSSNYYQQQSIPASVSQAQGTYGQPTGTFEYTRESYQSQAPLYDYQGTDQQSSQYLYNLEGIQQQQPQQQEAYNYASEATGTYLTSETDIQQPDQNQTISSSEHYQQQQQPVSIPVSQTYDSQLLGQRITGASIPTGTVEYTRQAYYSQEPLPDNYTTETYIKQHQQQQQQQQENQSLNVNDYLKRFETESYPQQTGGQISSSDDHQSINTVTTTPFIIQQNVNVHPSQGAAQTYNLQNYTNEFIASETSQPPFSSLIHEADQHHLLPGSEQYSERDTSTNETYSSLPPPPAARDEYHQESIVTNTTEFPAPPTPDRQTYQITPQRPSRLHPSIIPSADQPNIYTESQPLQPTSASSSDHGTDDDAKADEEIFDLRQCIAHCYAKYQDLWNKDQQRKYDEQIQGSQQSISDANLINNQQFAQYQQTTTNRQEQPGQYFGTGEIHFIDGSTQTPSHNVIKQSNIAQYKYDETSHLPTRDLSADSREQQTIEYSPPLINQTRHTIPTIPSSTFEYTRYEQQQQQPIYDHNLPVPPHLSFNDTDYQSNLYYSSQITAQPGQYQNIPFDTDEQQQRYRAHSEPPSIKQDSIASITPIQPTSSQIFEQQTGRSISIPMIHQEQTHIPQVRLLDNGRSYETEAIFQRRIPRIDPKTGLCLVPCPETQKYAHLPPHLRPELFCVELPPPGSLPPVPPPPPIQQQQQQQQQHQQHQQQQQRWCVRCCCVPGRSLIKKVVYKQAEEGQQQQEESHYDYASVIDQMGTRINVRYGNSIMEEGEAFVSGNYHEQLRIIDFPVYVSGKNDPTLTPLVPVK